MRIIARNRIIEYYRIHPDAQTALEDWFQKVRKAEWTCFADMKQTFGSVDSVGNQHYVFNIKGNNHRLIAVVKFTIKLVFIRFIGTHDEYGFYRRTKYIDVWQRFKTKRLTRRQWNG